MAMFVARFDLRVPPVAPARPPEMYAAALEMASYMEEHRFDMYVVSEHHGVDDGYLSSPVVMATAVAARTAALPVNVAALLVPLHDPLRLAEDIAVADLVSGGRISYVAGLGYRREEYDQLGIDWATRGELIESHLATMKKAWTGEPFDHDGRTVRVTPTPGTQPHPMVFYGGGAPVAARRAARLDLPFFPMHGDPALVEAYQAERERLGIGPGLALSPQGPGTVYVSEDPDRSWARLGEHLLYEATVYAGWNAGQHSAVKDTSTTVDEMRAAGVYRILTPDQAVALADEVGPMGAITTHPLCGGIPPELAWEHLETLATRVIPRVKGAG